MIETPDAGRLSLFKGFLHNCGRADILFKQVKKMIRIFKCHREFQKVKKTHGQFSRLMCLNIRNTVIEIKTRKNTLLTKNKVDASTPGHPRPSPTILFHNFLLAGSQEIIKKILSQVSSSPPTPASNFTVRSYD